MNNLMKGRLEVLRMIFEGMRSHPTYSQEPVSHAITAVEKSCNTNLLYELSWNAWNNP